MSAEPSVKSATRVFDVLRLFESARKPLRLKEIVAGAGFPTSSTAALLKSMTAQGYLRFDRHERSYFPTEALAQLVSWLPVAVYESEPVRSAMHSVQQQTHEYVALGTLNGIHVEFVHALRSSFDLQYWNPPGTKRLLIQSGMGWLLLGQQPKAAITRIYRNTIRAGAIAEDRFPLETLLATVEKHRGQEFSFTRPSDFIAHPGQDGVGIVAVLLPLPPNHRPLVLGVGGPADRLRANLQPIIRSLRSAVDSLEEHINPA